MQAHNLPACNVNTMEVRVGRGNHGNGFENYMSKQEFLANPDKAVYGYFVVIDLKHPQLLMKFIVIIP